MKNVLKRNRLEVDNSINMILHVLNISILSMGLLILLKWSLGFNKNIEGALYLGIGVFVGLRVMVYYHVLNTYMIQVLVMAHCLELVFLWHITTFSHYITTLYGLYIILIVMIFYSRKIRYIAMGLLFLMYIIMIAIDLSTIQQPIERIDYLDIVFGTMIIGVLILFVIEMYRRNISNTLGRIHDHVSMDPLTGIWNARVLDEALKKSRMDWEVNQKNYSLAIIDIDNFKGINDSYGHLNGDKVLVEIVNSIRKSLGGDDMFFRYGGDEFVILFQENSIEYGYQIFRDIFNQLDKDKIYINDQVIEVTISVGIADMQSAVDEDKGLFLLVDEHLYKAKALGKNCIV